MQRRQFLTIAGAVLAAPRAASAATGGGQPIHTAERYVEGLAVDAQGRIFLADVFASKVLRIHPGGSPHVLDPASGETNGLTIGPDGRLYGAAMKLGAILSWHPDTGERSTLADGIRPNDLAVHPQGWVFVTDPASHCVWRVGKSGPPVKAADFDRPNGIALGTDPAVLLVADFAGDTVFQFAVRPDGSLDGRRPAFRFPVPPDGKGLLDGMEQLPDGRLACATALGVQLARDSDPANTTRLPMPPGVRRANYLAREPAGTLLVSYEKHVERVTV